ncbi:hypothetical protein BDC45DRAFT_533894 [Circinella umbellata]|nr:hypothetical protein BDC45DRAFT_533894 [Circinella umbellata]
MNVLEFTVGRDVILLYKIGKRCWISVAELTKAVKPSYRRHSFQFRRFHGINTPPIDFFRATQLTDQEAAEKEFKKAVTAASWWKKKRSTILGFSKQAHNKFLVSFLNLEDKKNIKDNQVRTFFHTTRF